MFGCAAMASIMVSDMSFGCDVVNRTLISGAAVATADSSAAKSVVVPSSAMKR